MARIAIVLVLALWLPSRVLAQTEAVSLRELGGGEAALRSALAAGKSVDLSGLTVTTTSALTVPANQTVFNGTIDATAVGSGAAIVITNGPQTGGMPSWRALDRVIVRVHPNPGDGIHSSTTDGVRFSGMNIAITNVTVQGARNAWVIGDNAWSIQINDSMAWYNGEGLLCDRPNGGGAGIRLTHVEFAHNDYAVFNRLCEITFNDGSFDSAVIGYVRDNITSEGGTHNSLMLCNRCRFEGGGTQSSVWIKNSGYMLLRDPLFYEGGACSFLIANSGDLEISGGFSRLRSRKAGEEPGPDTPGCGLGQYYSASGSGRIGVRGLRPIDPSLPPLRFTTRTSRVHNGDLELSATVQGFASTAASTLSIDSEYRHDGSRSLKYRSNNTPSTLTSSTIAVSAGASAFQFSLYYTTRMASAQLLGYLEIFDAAGSLLSRTPADLSNTPSWKFVRWTGALPPNAAYAKLRISWDSATGGASAVVNLDDLYYTDW